tara:strand:- start:420 stop:620 length:201 start_codon:yes stop_codon:yes gene_type:complete
MDIEISEQDVAEVLRTRVNEVTSLQVRVAALSRTIAEQEAEIAKLKGEEASDAKSGKEEVSVHKKG